MDATNDWLSSEYRSRDNVQRAVHHSHPNNHNLPPSSTSMSYDVKVERLFQSTHSQNNATRLPVLVRPSSRSRKPLGSIQKPAKEDPFGYTAVNALVETVADLKVQLAAKDSDLNVARAERNAAEAALTKYKADAKRAAKVKPASLKVHLIIIEDTDSPALNLHEQLDNIDARRSAEEVDAAGAVQTLIPDPSQKCSSAPLHHTGSRANSSSRPSPAKKKAGGPLCPADALVRYKGALTAYEKKEIKDYDAIYFAAPTVANKIRASKGMGDNCGYDDENGRYLIVKNDHIGYRYEMLTVLGKGTYGTVVKGFDHKTKTVVAIKIIRNEKRFHKQALSEVKILELLRKEDTRDDHNVIHMKDSFEFRGHVCITFEMMKCDLYNQLKKDGFKGFAQEVIKDYTKALVTSLCVLRRSGIIHADLKPVNIMLQADGMRIKIIDFGSSCFDHQRVHTYIQSRTYRSPEVIMKVGYGFPIDMWSLGCILAELHTGRPLFCGKNAKEMLMCQMDMLGVPDFSLVDYKPLDLLLATLQDFKGQRRKPGTGSLEKALGCIDPGLYDFIARCLVWDPTKRLTPNEAANHEFVCRSYGPYSNAALTTAVKANKSMYSKLHAELMNVAAVRKPQHELLVKSGKSIGKDGADIRNRRQENGINGASRAKAAEAITNDTSAHAKPATIQNRVAMYNGCEDCKHLLAVGLRHRDHEGLRNECLSIFHSLHSQVKQLEAEKMVCKGSLRKSNLGVKKLQEDLEIAIQHNNVQQQVQIYLAKRGKGPLSTPLCRDDGDGDEIPKLTSQVTTALSDDIQKLTSQVTTALSSVSSAADPPAQPVQALHADATTTNQRTMAATAAILRQQQMKGKQKKREGTAGDDDFSSKSAETMQTAVDATAAAADKAAEELDKRNVLAHMKNVLSH